MLFLLPTIPHAASKFELFLRNLMNACAGFSNVRPRTWLLRGIATFVEEAAQTSRTWRLDERAASLVSAKTSVTLLTTSCACADEFARQEGPSGVKVIPQNFAVDGYPRAALPRANLPLRLPDGRLPQPSSFRFFGVFCARTRSPSAHTRWAAHPL
jgi:hypothetical protein